MRPSTITSNATTNRDTVMRRTGRIDIGEPHTKGGIVGPANGVVRFCEEGGG